MLKKFLSLTVVVIFLFIAAVSVSAEEPYKIEDYTVVAENATHQLLANMETGDFAVFNPFSGSIWYSGQWATLDEDNSASELNVGRVKTDLVSVLAVNYVQVSTIASTAVPSYQNSYAYCVIKGNVSTKKIKNGYRAEYYFSDIDSTIPVEITLTDDGFQARIVGKDIKMGKKYWITSIELLPGFMAADSNLEGYLFVPSGSGGIIPLNSGKGDFASYSEMVYGEDAAIEQEEYDGEKLNVMVPVYGLVRGNQAVTAIIVEGDTSARIRAEANSSTTSFTRVFSDYVTAIVDNTTLFESDFSNQRVIYGIEKRKSFSDYTVCYHFLSDDAANYSGMAALYRDYLSLESKAKEPSLYLTLYGAATKKASFLGIPYTKTVSLTSFKETNIVLNEMNKAGIPVSLQYIGWNNSGIENKKTPVKYNPVAVLGGKSGFRDLFEFIKSSDNTLYCDLDFLSVRKSRIGFSALSDVCKSIFNTRTPQYKYMRSVYVPVNTENPWYLLKPPKVISAANKFLRSFDYGTGLSFSGFGNTLYSDFTGQNGERSDTVTCYQKVLKSASKKHPIAVSVGNAYTYDYTDSIFSLPMTNDGNLLFSESVPFVQMVLHGAISYGAEKNASLLDCIEYGANPYFSGIYVDDNTLIETSFNWLSGTTYKSWSADAKKIYSEYAKVYKRLYSNQIVSHSHENGLTSITFDNGTVILINRSDSNRTFNEVEIPAQDFRVIGG